MTYGVLVKYRLHRVMGVGCFNGFMLTQECEKHEMIGCLMCNEPSRPEVVNPDRQPDSKTFTAKWSGRCAACGCYFGPGAKLRYRVYTERDNAVVHATC